LQEGALLLALKISATTTNSRNLVKKSQLIFSGKSQKISNAAKKDAEIPQGYMPHIK
jgi:hypothetical protein